MLQICNACNTVCKIIISSGRSERRIEQEKKTWRNKARKLLKLHRILYVVIRLSLFYVKSTHRVHSFAAAYSLINCSTVRPIAKFTDLGPFLFGRLHRPFHVMILVYSGVHFWWCFYCIC